MRRVLSPIPLAVLATLAALVALLAYGLVQNEPDNSFEDAAARGEREPAPDFELPRLEGSRRAEPGRLPRPGGGAQLLGVVV